MILDKGLLGIEIQPVIISRELPVKREDDLSGKKGRQRCLRSCLLSLCDLFMPHGQLLQVGDPADIRRSVPFLQQKSGDEIRHADTQGEAVGKSVIRILGDSRQKDVFQPPGGADDHLSGARSRAAAEKDLPYDPLLQIIGGETGFRTRPPQIQEFLRKTCKFRRQPFEQDTVPVSPHKSLPGGGDHNILHVSFPEYSRAGPGKKAGTDLVRPECSEPAHSLFIFPGIQKIPEEPLPLRFTAAHRLYPGKEETNQFSCIPALPAASLQAQQDELCMRREREQAAVQKTSCSLHCLLTVPETDPGAAAESQPLRKSVRILRQFCRS